jgi:hypothetical protein
VEKAKLDALVLLVVFVGKYESLPCAPPRRNSV